MQGSRCAGPAGDGGALVKRTAPASDTVTLLVDMWLTLGTVTFDARAGRAYRVTWSNAALETDLPQDTCAASTGASSTTASSVRRASPIRSSSRPDATSS